MKKFFSLFLVVLLILAFCIPPATGESDKVLINMQIGNKVAFVNGQSVSLDVPPQIINGRTLVPIRFVSENLGADVQWDGNTKTVSINMDSISYLKSKISSLEGEKSNLLRDKNSLQDSITSLQLENTTLQASNNALQDRITQIEKDKADLVSQISVLQQKIDELQKGTSGNTASQIAAQNNQNIVFIEKKDSTNQIVATGSGFIATADGKVVTNYHVIDGAYSVTVKLNDSRTYSISEVINYDKDRDIAVLKLPVSNINSVTLGNSSNIANGDDVVVIGNPLGLQNTVTTGVISSTNRIINNQVWIQFSAPISPGSSGGPVFNSEGEVIGVVTMKVVKEDVEGINFAVPINDAKTLLSYNKSATFVELFGAGTTKSWTLTQADIQNAINWGKATVNDVVTFFQPFTFAPMTGWKTNGVILTPYQWIAFYSRKNAIEGKDFTYQDAQDMLSLWGDKVSFMIGVYGDTIDFAKYYSAKVTIGNKISYPIVSDNEDIASITKVYPSSPKYQATNLYVFNNLEISRDAVITFVINNGFGKEENFVIDLSKYP